VYFSVKVLEGFANKLAASHYCIPSYRWIKKDVYGFLPIEYIYYIENVFINRVSPTI